jgi:hexosaminidase
VELGLPCTLRVVNRGALLITLALVACPEQLPPPEPWTHLIPRPSSVTTVVGTFTLTRDASIGVEPGQDLEPIAELLAATLRASTGAPIPVAAMKPKAAIRLRLDPALSDLGDEGYELTVDASGVTVAAPRAAGVFYGTQTFRQLLPVTARPQTIATGTIRDQPRFAWRGLMIDVARHFFAPAEVRRFIDVMAHYKLNRLHLHLTDDQGWRIQIDAWPALTTIGGSIEVGGGAGGFFTKADYADLVQYAAARFVTVVPEIDVPGHTGAALSSIPALNCDGVAPPPYTGVAVGLSSLCIRLPVTETFVRDVIGEVAAMTPGPWIHVGGDEAKMTSDADYRAFMSMVRDVVRANGKHFMGWEEVHRISPGPDDLVQHWLDPTAAIAANANGAKVVLSPAKRAYLDMKYELTSPPDVGTFWAGFVNVQTAYDWDPGTFLIGVPENDVLGVEGAVWTETIATVDDLDVMVFPRLLGLAELGWSPQRGHSVRDYFERLGANGPRLKALGVGYFAAPQVPWAP